MRKNLLRGVKVPNANLYEHIDPALVGNERAFSLSNQSGAANVRILLEVMGYTLEGKEDPRITQVLQVLKDRTSKGYDYDSAEASLELLVWRTIGLPVPPVSPRVKPTIEL